jgi:hypothetical protein
MTEAEWLACTDPAAMLEFIRGKANDRKLRLFACACCRRVWNFLSDDEWGRRLVELAERFADGAACPEEVENAQEQSDSAAACLGFASIGARSTARRDPSAIPNAFALYKKAGACWAAFAAIHPDAAYAASQAAAEAASASLDFAQPLDDLDRKILGLPLSWPRSSWWFPARIFGDWQSALERRWRPERSEQAGIIRDLLNPFVSISVSPAVLDRNDALVVRLAQAAYAERHLPDGTLDNGRLAILADALEEAGCTDVDILSHLRSPGPHVRGCWPLDLCLGKS